MRDSGPSAWQFFIVSGLIIGLSHGALAAAAALVGFAIAEQMLRSFPSPEERFRRLREKDK